MKWGLEQIEGLPGKAAGQSLVCLIRKSVGGGRVAFIWPILVALRGFGLLFGRRRDDHRFKNQVVRSDSGWDIAFIFPILFMLSIFNNAKRRINEATSADEKRQVLLALGQSALEEHPDWILMHRKKSLDQGEIFRMGS